MNLIKVHLVLFLEELEQILWNRFENIEIGIASKLKFGIFAIWAIIISELFPFESLKLKRIYDAAYEWPSF